MIARIWYGYTTPENADAYETLLRTEIFRAFSRAMSLDSVASSCCVGRSAKKSSLQL
jgi:hypothetical protein